MNEKTQPSNAVWKSNQDEAGILWLGLDRQDKALNSLTIEALEQLQEHVETIDKKTKGLVIYSEKSAGFIAGADIPTIIEKRKTEDGIKGFLELGHETFKKLNNLKCPTVAMVSGVCLGGGLELALACDYIIADEDDKTHFGLPEVTLGFNPGWGGTVRLYKRLAAPQALDLLLTGRRIKARAAKKMGLIDAAVPMRQLKNAAKVFVSKKPKPKLPPIYNEIFRFSWARKLLVSIIHKKVQTKVRPEHYPAPFEILNLFEKSPWRGQAALEDEINTVLNIMATSETPENLFRVYNLQEQLKGLAKQSDFKAKRVHVIGAGTMGGDIAAWCALRGLHVSLQDMNDDLLSPAIKRAHQLFKKKLKHPRKITHAMDKLIPDVAGDGIKGADVIIEAIVENLDAKQKLFKILETKAKPDAILATNTSTIPLKDIAAGLKHKNRLLGIHFFNPVAKMMLVEIVGDDNTDKKTLERATAFVGQIGKLPLPVKSSPGFLVNRVLMPYLLESVVLLEEGVPADVVDNAAKEFGMPLGPIELGDTIGLDICLAAAETLVKYYDVEIPNLLYKMVEKKQLGRKTGRGFYQYKKGKPEKVKSNYQGLTKTQIADRLILRMVNEAATCLREGVVSSDDLLDAGMIFGTGFAPFRGGPMHYAQRFGKQQLGDLFSKLEAEYGERFRLKE